MASKTELVREALKHKPDPNPQEIEQIAADIDCSKALVYKVLRKMPKPTGEAIHEAHETVIKVGEQRSEEVPSIEEETTTEEAPTEEVVIEEEAPTEEKIEGIAERVSEGFLTAEDCTYVWQAINELFPTKHQRPNKAMAILGKLWVKPTNRLIEKYMIENFDLYIAIGITLITFAPSIKGMLQDRKKKQKKKEESDIVG